MIGRPYMKNYCSNKTLRKCEKKKTFLKLLAETVKEWQLKTAFFDT